MKRKQRALYRGGRVGVRSWNGESMEDEEVPCANEFKKVIQGVLEWR